MCRWRRRFAAGRLTGWDDQPRPGRGRLYDERTDRLAALPDLHPQPLRQSSSPLQAIARSLEEQWPVWSNESKRELLQEMVEYIVLNRADLTASEIVWKSMA